MKIRLIGLGKMGWNLAINLKRNGHEVSVYDIDSDKVNEAKEAGMDAVCTLESLVSKSNEERFVWLMIPAGQIVDDTIEKLVPMLKKGDTIIDGGNSFYKDSIRRYHSLKNLGINFLDAGVSGGMEGALNGVCAMIGGEKEVFDKVEELFKDISVKDGYLYTGPSGSGHFTKMIHNGIEYGMLQAIGEGFEIMESSNFNLDFEKVSKLWNNGSVIRGWLMQLTESAFSKDAQLDSVKGTMYSNGEGLWAAQTALELQIPAPIITTSVMMRYRSVQEDTFSGKVVAALRNEFGGHAIKENK